MKKIIKISLVLAIILCGSNYAWTQSVYFLADTIILNTDGTASKQIVLKGKEKHQNEELTIKFNKIKKELELSISFDDHLIKDDLEKDFYAEIVWSDSTGKNIFTYSNLIYLGIKKKNPIMDNDIEDFEGDETYSEKIKNLTKTIKYYQITPIDSIINWIDKDSISHYKKIKIPLDTLNNNLVYKGNCVKEVRFIIPQENNWAKVLLYKIPAKLKLYSTGKEDHEPSWKKKKFKDMKTWEKRLYLQSLEDEKKK